MSQHPTLSGTFPVLCTPFKADGAAPDLDQFDALIEFVVALGADGCTFPGTASEVETLSDAERELLVKHLGQKLDGRIPFVVGASSATPEGVLQHVSIGAQAGASAAMVMAPYSIGRDPSAQQAFYAAIGDGAAIDIMLQNAPQPIGAGLEAATVAQIAKAVPAVRYVKEETLPCGQNLTSISAACGDAIAGVFGGAGGRYIVDELARGGLGTMPASEFADLHVGLVNAFRAGDEVEARRLFEVMLPALNFQAIFRMHMTKETLRMRGVLSTVHVRGKGPAMDEGDHAELEAWLARLVPEFKQNPPSFASVPEAAE